MARAKRGGVDVIAVTDHDVTDALDDAAAHARDLGLGLIPGVEISATWNAQTLHVLALNVDPTDKTLQAGLARLREVRDARARAIAARLEKAGIPGAYDGIRARARGPILSRTHFAQWLCAQGHAADTKVAFKKFLKKGGPAHVPVEWAPLAQVVAWIRAAGGEAVIAHPARYRFGSAVLARLFEEFKQAGGVGVEVISGSHSADDCARFARLARKFGFRASVGSDYHGPEQPWLGLGGLPSLPADCVPVWRDWTH